jgi:Ca-activated chloride channel family protein
MTPYAGFAAAVAQLGRLLRHNPYRGTATYGDVAALARTCGGEDSGGYRAEFVRLVELAEALTRQTGK